MGNGTFCTSKTIREGSSFHDYLDIDECMTLVDCDVNAECGSTGSGIYNLESIIHTFHN